MPPEPEVVPPEPLAVPPVPELVPPELAGVTPLPPLPLAAIRRGGLGSQASVTAVAAPEMVKMAKKVFVTSSPSAKRDRRAR